MDYRRILFSREPEYKINALDEDEMKMSAIICGYLGHLLNGNVNRGRLNDIYSRVNHTDNETEWDEVLSKNAASSEK